MLLLIESLIGIALFTLIVIPMDLKDPLAVIGDYPPAIRKRCEELGLIEKRKQQLSRKDLVAVDIELMKKQEEMKMCIGRKIALFLGGTLFGSAGLKILSSKDARKVYTHTTAAVLRCKDEVMKQVDFVQESCSDILADAKQINADREKAAEAEYIEESAQA